MKALTVRQPWCWAIAMGHKNIENRSWTTTHRGPLAIHAAARWDDHATDALRAITRTLKRLGLPYPRTLAEDQPYSGLGKVMAVVDLDDICTAQLDGETCECGPWAQPRQAHWQLRNVRRLTKPIPAKGRLSLWDIDLDLREVACA